MELQTSAALLMTALLFGGMTLYSFAFAGFLFTQLPADKAGELLRRAFPMFYLWVIVSAALAGILHLGLDATSAACLAAVAITTIPARQQLMPAINMATDTGQQKRFKQLHGLSVLLGVAQIGVIGYVLLRLV